MTIDEIYQSGERMRLILWRHLAMPLEDHDGGDEDDQLVKDRQFLRALRKPRSVVFQSEHRSDRLYVVQGIDHIDQLVPVQFRDPGDEGRP